MNIVPRRQERCLRATRLTSRLADGEAEAEWACAVATHAPRPEDGSRDCQAACSVQKVLKT